MDLRHANRLDLICSFWKFRGNIELIYLEESFQRAANNSFFLSTRIGLFIRLVVL